MHFSGEVTPEWKSRRRGIAKGPRRSDTAKDGFMGALLSAECSTCGYGTEIYAGFGFAGIEFEPHVCDRCREIVDVAIAIHLLTPDAPDLNRCPTCGGDRVRALRFESAGSSTSATSLMSSSLSVP